MLIAQLEFGKTTIADGMVIGVHTPRSDKTEMTESTLNILARFPELVSSLVVDHCTPDTISGVIDAGFRAGVTLSSDKTSREEMTGIVAAYSGHLDRIMCNTDSGSLFFEDAVRFSRSEDLPEETRQQLFLQNAAQFFSIDAS